MGRAVLLWLRRSSLAVAFPAMVVLVLVTAWSRTGWEYEYAWALSWTASVTILLGPVVAGLVAHDRARRHAPTFTLVEGSSPRGSLAALTLPLAATVLAFTAWTLAAAVVLAWVWWHDAADTPPVTLFLEMLVVLTAAAFLGAAVGTWTPTRAAGPLAAVLVYALIVFADSVELGGLMTAGGSVSSTVGWRRDPDWLVGFVVLHLALAIAAGLVVRIRQASGPVLRGTLTFVAFAMVIGAAVGFHTAKEDGLYRDVVVPSVCFGDAPEVCGPRDVEPVLRIAAAGLADAYRDLADADLPLRERYVLARGLPGGVFPTDAGDLSADTSTFRDGRYSRDDAVMTIAVPTLCEAFFADEPPEQLMQAQSVLHEWLSGRLDRGTTGPAPADVRSAYLNLLECEPRRTPLS